MVGYSIPGAVWSDKHRKDYHFPWSQHYKSVDVTQDCMRFFLAIFNCEDPFERWVCLLDYCCWVNYGPLCTCPPDFFLATCGNLHFSPLDCIVLEKLQCLCLSRSFWTLILFSEWLATLQISWISLLSPRLSCLSKYWSSLGWWHWIWGTPTMYASLWIHSCIKDVCVRYGYSDSCI